MSRAAGRDYGAVIGKPALALLRERAMRSGVEIAGGAQAFDDSDLPDMAGRAVERLVECPVARTPFSRRRVDLGALADALDAVEIVAAHARDGELKAIALEQDAQVKNL